MGRKKIVVNNVTFADNETLQEKILNMFSLKELITNYNEQNLINYKAILEHENILQILSDKDLMITIDCFFENNLNSSITSSKIFMHRNTLNYRLEKVRKLIGLNLKLFEHAVVFKNMITINDMINKNQ